MKNVTLGETLAAFKSSPNVAVITSKNEKNVWAQDLNLVKYKPEWALSSLPVIVNKTKFICPYCYAIGEIAYIKNHYCFQENNDACPACGNNANSAHINSAGCYQSFKAIRIMDLTTNGVKYDSTASSWLVSKEVRIRAYDNIRKKNYDSIVYINNILTSEEKSYNANGYHGICHWISQISKMLMINTFTLPCNCLFEAQSRYYGISTVDVIAYFAIKYNITMAGKDSACIFCKASNMTLSGANASQLYFLMMVHVKHMQDSSPLRDQIKTSVMGVLGLLTPPKEYNPAAIADTFNQCYIKALASVTNVTN